MSMIPKKPAPHLMRGGNRFSEKIMLHEIRFGPGGLNRTTDLRLMRALLLTAELHRAGSGGRTRTFNLPIQSRPRRQLRHPRTGAFSGKMGTGFTQKMRPNKKLIGAACGIRTRVDRFEGPGSCSARRRRRCLERAAGIEPATDGLEDRGSASELYPR